MSNLFGRHVAALCCLWLLSPAWTPAAAEAQDRPASGAEDSGSGDEEEDPGADDAFSFGEEDNQDSPAAPVTKPPPPSAWSLTGFLRSDWALWTERLDSTPLAKGRQSVDLALGFKKGIVRVLLTLHGEYDLAYLVDRGSHDEPTREAYEWQVNTREALVALSLGEFELTLGRQIVAWGEGDALSPLDVVNPRDMREPGLADLDDIRLPVLASRVGWFRGPHRVEVMMIHESDFGYRPSPTHPTAPSPRCSATTPWPPPCCGARPCPSTTARTASPSTSSSCWSAGSTRERASTWASTWPRRWTSRGW